MKQNDRLISLDFFRGFTMFLLINGGLLSFFSGPEYDGTVVQIISKQFTHPEWIGFRFWDLIQPFFMFIVGVAIPFSIANRISQGDSWAKLTRHAARRSIILILLGITLGFGGSEFSLTFQNVLAQIGFTYFITFLLMRTKPSVQMVVSIGLIAITAALYRLFPLSGDLPFVRGQTFGDYINLIIAPGSSGNWASFNAVPTAAHTIWGALCGQLLRSNISSIKKLQILIVGGSSALLLGYALTPVSPIIKHICTSSFVFISGGWSILALALAYWIIDMKQYRNWTKFATIIGMNSIFIYLFSGTIRGVVHRFIEPWISLVFSWVNSPTFVEVLLLAIAWFFNWYVCYLLYKKRIFIKI